MRHPFPVIATSSLLVLTSWSGAHATTVAEARALVQQAVEAKKTFEANGFTALAKLSKDAVEPITLRPDWTKATLAVSLYVTGCSIYRDAPAAAKQSDAAAYFGPASVGGVLNQIGLANGFGQDDMRRVVMLGVISYQEAFGRIKPGVLAARLEQVETIRKAADAPTKEIGENGMEGLKKLCTAKGETVRKGRDETAAIEYLTFVFYGAREHAQTLEKDKKAKPDPYFADPLATVTEPLKPFNVQDVRALAAFVGSEIEDAIKARDEDDDDDTDPHCG